MKKTLKSFLVVFVFLFLADPLFVRADSADDRELSYRAVLLELIEVLQKQIIYLQSSVATDKVTVEGDLFSEEVFFQGEIDVVARYVVSQPAEISRVSDDVHRAYFSRVFDIFPEEYDIQIGQVLVFSDTDNFIDAFVETIPPTNTDWLYAVSQSVVDDVSSAESSELIIHELAHLVAYEEVIGVPNPAHISCHSYFSEYGCPAKNSYLDQFVIKFWSDRDLDRVEGLGGLVDSLDTVSLYYKNNSTQFVTEYAALSPEEDWSESFVYFILNKPVKGGVIKQKIDFFSQQEDLISIKNEIRKNI